MSRKKDIVINKRIKDDKFLWKKDNLNIFLLLKIKNCRNEKHKDNHKKKFPKKLIIINSITILFQYVIHKNMSYYT